MKQVSPRKKDVPLQKELAKYVTPVVAHYSKEKICERISPVGACMGGGGSMSTYEGSGC